VLLLGVWLAGRRSESLRARRGVSQNAASLCPKAFVSAVLCHICKISHLPLITAKSKIIMVFFIVNSANAQQLCPSSVVTFGSPSPDITAFVALTYIPKDEAFGMIL